MTWILNSDVVNGLSDIGINARPAIFYDSGVWKLIATDGNNGGGATGWYWNGSAWVVDSDIVSGLSGVWLYGNSNVTIFDDGGTWKLLWASQYLPTQVPNFRGYYWNGSTWVGDGSVASGFDTYYDNVVVSAFNDSGTIRLLLGTLNGWILQYVWGGSSWSYEGSVMYSSARSAGTFVDEGIPKAILVGGGGYYKSTGTTWIEDSSISDGIGSGHHAVFKDGDVWKAVVGNSDGTFSGYAIPVQAEAVNTGRPLRRSTGASIPGGISCGMGKKR